MFSFLICAREVSELLRSREDLKAGMSRKAGMRRGREYLGFYKRSEVKDSVTRDQTLPCTKYFPHGVYFGICQMKL
jgi:hypothetical protein